MPFTVYILYSVALDQYYTGQTENLEDRLFGHNNSGSRSTKKVNDWKLVYSEFFKRVVRRLDEKVKLRRKKAGYILSG